jgi:hypothetical protein
MARREAGFGDSLGHRDATRVALTGSFQWAFWVCGAIALLAPLTTTVLLRRKLPSEIEPPLPALEEAIKELAA